MQGNNNITIKTSDIILLIIVPGDLRSLKGDLVQKKKASHCSESKYTHLP